MKFGTNSSPLVRLQFGKFDNLDVLPDGDVGGVEWGEEDELALPVLSSIVDDVSERHPPIHRVHEHIKLVQNPRHTHNAGVMIDVDNFLQYFKAHVDGTALLPIQIFISESKLRCGSPGYTVARAYISHFNIYQANSSGYIIYYNQAKSFWLSIYDTIV